MGYGLLSFLGRPIGLLLGAGALVALAAPALNAQGEQTPPKKGEIVFQTGFESAEEQKAWSKAPFASWETGRQSKTALRVQVSESQATNMNAVRLPLDLSRYRGYKLHFECMVRAENVTKPPQNYNGVKFMLHYQSATGPQWINQGNVYGTFDWKPLTFTATIAKDATDAELDLGLQACHGTAWFDDIRVTVLSMPKVRPTPPVNPPPAFRGHNLPRLRGVMSPNTFQDEDFRVLGQEWKANVIRWQITRNWGATGTERDLEEYDRWIDSELADLDKVLEAGKRYGIKVVIDMHSPPGGRHENRDLAICHEPKYQDHFVAFWEKVARRYKGHPAVWGYDLVNEPVQNKPPAPGVDDFLGIQVRAAKAIRRIDPKVPIFIEADAWDSPDAFRELDPVDVPNVIYQVHMYQPGQFTHQGVHGSAVGVSYPGKIGSQQWDKEQLRRVLQPVRDFQLAYNTHIYVGEFSAIRWAPGNSAYQYLKDCIEIFEEYGWDWTYHAYREWDGWSVEHGSDPKDRKPTKEPTDRKRLLLEWFSKNHKP